MERPEVTRARARFQDGGGMLFAFRHGYSELGAVLEALPPDEWRRDEAVLGGLVLHLVKHGQAARAKSYLTAETLTFEKTYQFDVLDLLLALHLGEPVSDRKLTAWRRLERKLPISAPLLQGLYYNAMLAMMVRLGRLEDARVAGQQAISCYREDGHVYLEHFIHIHLADVDVIEGRLRRARRSLDTARRCLEQADVRYGNEDEVIAVIQLAIDYESGLLERVSQQAPKLRASLLNGDSWSELFFQLARVSVLSTYFLRGRQAAWTELESCQADYARRHSGAPTTIDVLQAMICHLEWQPNEAEHQLAALQDTPMHSALGSVLRAELLSALGPSAPPPAPRSAETPRGAIVAALQHAQRARGPARRKAIETALRLALENGQIAPFLEHRDVFLGVSAKLSKGAFARGHRSLSRLANRVLRQVEQCYVVPEPLRDLGFNRRQYRVAAALQFGATNKQVARQLGTSEATVKYHLTALYRLTGRQGRSDLSDFMEEIRDFQIS